jgi:ubiquitin fusion degradation protein 1
MIGANISAEQRRLFGGLYKAVGIIEAVPSNPEWNYGGKVCLPLEMLTLFQQDMPKVLVFNVFNESNDGRHHEVNCGVIDFIAKSGEIWCPDWMLKRLNIDTLKAVEVTVTPMRMPLPKATSVVFHGRADEVDDLLRLGAKVILEKHLRSFVVLTQDDVIPVEFNNRIYDLTVMKTEPSDVVETIDTDIAVDFFIAKNGDQK